MSRDRHHEGAPCVIPRLDARDASACRDRRGRDPDFLIIGAGRSGTTTLAETLGEHPNVFMCEPKEPFFFSHAPVYARGDDWYRGLFARCREDQICGEASTSYSVWPECGNVAGRIARALPQAKLIYIMRHPVERAYSCYNYDVVRLRLRLSFEEALEREAHRITSCCYMEQIQQYLPYFPRSSFLFLLLEDLAAKPQETLAKVWDFFAVAPLPAGSRSRVENSGVEHYVRMQTTQRLRALPGVSRLAEALPRSWRDGSFRWFIRTPVYRWVARGHRFQPMRPETRDRLLQRFRGPNDELAKFLDRDLSAWSH